MHSYHPDSSPIPLSVSPKLLLLPTTYSPVTEPLLFRFLTPAFASSVHIICVHCLLLQIVPVKAITIASKTAVCHFTAVGKPNRNAELCPT